MLPWSKFWSGFGAFLLLSPFFGSIALAGPGAWTGNGLPGGDVVALVIDPDRPSILYAGTSAGLFKSLNGGETWAATGYGGSVLSIAVDGLLPGRVYVGSAGTGVFLSSDGGVTWISADLQGRWISALAIDPMDSGRLYAGTTVGELFRSLDAGQTWKTSNLEPPFGAAISSIAVDSRNPGILYAAAGPVFKSTDAGATWFASGSNFSATVVMIDPKTPQILYAGGVQPENGGTDPGIFRSSDGGESWIVPTNATHLGKVTALAIDPIRPSTMYAGSVLYLFSTGLIGVGVSVSRDRATTWQPFNHGDSRMAGSFVRALVIDGTGRRLHAATSVGVFDYEVLPNFSVTLPAAASLHGIPPAFFHSDVAVFNSSSAGTASVTATYRCISGVCGDSPRNLSIPPRQVLLFEDIVASLFVAPETSGAIEFSSTEPIVVTSRLYTPARPAPTVGMFVPGLGPKKEFVTSQLTNLSHSADPSVGFRTNLGVFNASDQTRIVFFNCRESSGSYPYLGSTARQVGPHQLAQINDGDLFRELAVARDVPAFYCTVSPDASVPLYAWASVIDNQSEDSFFVNGQEYQPPSGSSPEATVTLPAAASLHGSEETFFRSDVAVLNQDTQFPVDVTARYRCFLGSCGTSETSFTLAPGEMRVFADAVGSLFGAPETGGTVELNSHGRLAIGSRLYTPAPAGGTVGMFVPGVARRESSPSLVLMLLSPSADRSKGSRVNVGVFNPNDAPQAVTLRLFTTTGLLLGSLSRSLGGQRGLQVNDFLASVGVSSDLPAAYCLAEGDGAHPIFAYAAVIDNQSQDPIFVTGQDDPESPRIESRNQ